MEEQQLQRTREYLCPGQVAELEADEQEEQVHHRRRKERREQLCVSDVHSRNLRMLERRALQIQYLLACLSTLGGAHHLCNKPKEAMQLALRQEYLGFVLGSTQVIVRARVFQAVNLALLGQVELSRRCFRRILTLAKAEEQWNAGLVPFVKASARWVVMELAERAKGEEEARN